jgi:hypothetical protein
MGNSMKKLQTKLKTRDVTFLKPKGFEDWLTITELSVKVGKDISWLRKLERDKRIPKAKRVNHGELRVRLWSPVMVDEIQSILGTLKRGRPRKSNG